MSDERLHPSPSDDFGTVCAGKQGTFESTDIQLTIGNDLPSTDDLTEWTAKALSAYGIKIGRSVAARNVVVGDAVYNRSRVYHVVPYGEVRAAVDAMVRYIGEKHGSGTVMPAGSIFAYLVKRDDERNKVRVRRCCRGHDENESNHDFVGDPCVLLGAYYVHIPKGVL